MTPEDIPQELLDILDARAGKQHSREGRVVAALAEILTRYDELRKHALREQVCREIAYANRGQVTPYR